MVTGKVKATFQQDGFSLVSSPITAVAIYDPIQFPRSTPDHTKASLEKSASVKPNPHVITASKDAITVWFANSASGEHRTLSHEALDGSVVSLVVYPGNGKADCPALVVATLKEGKVMVYDMDGKRRAREFDSGHAKAVSCAALYIPKEQAENEDGSWNPLLLTASADVIVCDLFTGQRSSRRLDGHDNLVTCMAVYNPEDVDATPLVLTGSIDKCILIWDLKTGEKLQVLQFEHSIWCLSIYAPREAKVKGIAPLIVSSGKHGAQVWDLATGSLLRSLPAASAAGKGKTDPALSLAVFPYSFEPASLPVIITASSHQSESTLWNLNSKVSLLHSLEKAHSKEVNKVTSFALSMGAEEEPRPVAITISNDATAVIWDLETGIKDVVLQGGHSGPITQVVVHPGRASEIPRIITAGLGVEEDKNKVVLTVWNMETGKVEHALKGHSKEVTCLVAVSPKMQIVSGSQDGHVAVWDISTGTVSKVLIGYPAFGAIAQPAVGAGTAALKSAESAAKSVFGFTSKSTAKGAGGKKGGASAEAAMTTQQKKLDLPPITAMALYSEGKEPRDTHFLLVAFKTNTIALWSVNDAQELKTFTHGTAITSLLALNAKYFSFPVVVATGGNSVVAWNVTSGAQLMTYSGHSDVVTASAVYLPVDTRALAVLVTASKDKSAILWDLRSGAKLRVLNHTAPINSVTVTTSGTCDGDFLVTTTTTGKNSTASVWLEYAMDLPPLSESVYSLFVTDSETRVNGTYNWDRIRNVASISKTFWVENGHLFTSVFTLKNRDKMMMVSFYKAFASALPGVIDRLPLVNGVSVLEHALEERIPVHQIILDAWSIALQQPCETFVRQVFHPCVGLDKNGLLLLAKYFPGLFIEFICKVEMVKSHALVHDKCSSYVISNSWIVEGMKPEVSSNMWSQAGYYSDTTNTSAQTVTAYMIPIIGVADISMLKAFVDTSTSLDDLSVFESHVGIAAFDYAWETFGRTVHLWTLFRYAVYLALFTTSLVTFDRLETSGDAGQRGVAWAMQGLVLLFTASYVFDEFAQFHDSHMRAQLAKFKARSKNALGAGMQSLQSLQNIFTAGNTTTAGADSSTGNTAGAKPAAAVESAKVRERRAKRGSLIENIPSGPLIEDVSSSSARASAHPGGREKMSKRGSALELTPSTSTSTTRNLTPPPPPTTRSSPSGDLPPPPPPAPGAAAESTAAGTASAGKKELTFNFDADGAAAADGTLQHILSGVFKTTLKVDRKVLLRRFRNSRFMGLLNHLSEFWNLLDMLVIVLVFAGTILRCAHQGETNRSRCVLAVASVFAWFKLLYFMRPFKSSGLLGKFPLILN
jgi:WD40 repeat protein